MGTLSRASSSDLWNGRTARAKGESRARHGPKERRTDGKGTGEVQRV